MISAILATLLAALSASTTQATQRIERAAGSGGAGSATITPPISASTDPDDLAMAFPVQAPCTSPCFKQGLVYQRTGSALDPEEGIKAYAMDLFRSARTPARNAPVIVLLHGGGFVVGDRTQMRPMAESLAGAGYLVATIDYRLVPESRTAGASIASDADLIPASAEAEADAERALRWIRKHRRTLGAAKDARRYAVGGYSAGAIAALRVGVRGGDRSTAPGLRFRVGAAFSISGTECGSWTKAYSCSAAYDRADPPLLIFHGEADSIVPFDWGRSTCEAAAARGGGCTGYYYPGQDHLWLAGTIFGGGDGLKASHPAVLPTVAKFLARRLAAR